MAPTGDYTVTTSNAGDTSYLPTTASSIWYSSQYGTASTNITIGLGYLTTTSTTYATYLNPDVLNPNVYLWEPIRKTIESEKESESQKQARLAAEREQQQRQEQEKAERARAVAKAEQLLRENTTEKQISDLVSIGFIELDSRHYPNHKYRVRRKGMIEVVDQKGKVVDRLCIHSDPALSMPEGDEVLAKLLLLQSAEEYVVKTANHHGAA